MHLPASERVAPCFGGRIVVDRVSVVWMNGLPCHGRFLARRCGRVLGTVLMGPGEVLVLIVITAVVVFITMRRGRIK